MYEQNSIHDNDNNVAGYSDLNEDPSSAKEAATYLRMSLATIRAPPVTETTST